MPAYHYTTIPHFFLQDSELQDRPIAPRFGLLSYFPSWSEFCLAIEHEQEICDDGEDIKVFWLCRHGQGFHNVGEAKYGTEAWDAHWSLLNEDGDITWGPDPLLTQLGKAQAQSLQQAWRWMISSSADGSGGGTIPFPQQCFVSPLTRAIETHEIAYGEELTRRGPGRTTVILENLREECGIHTCDKRQSRTYLQNDVPVKYPNSGFVCEKRMTEDDEVWKADERETHADVIERAKKVLGTMWDYNTAEGDDDATYIAITAHGGIINGILGAVGRERYALPTGGMLPVVIKRSIV